MEIWNIKYFQLAISIFCQLVYLYFIFLITDVFLRDNVLIYNINITTENSCLLKRRTKKRAIKFLRKMTNFLAVLAQFFRSIKNIKIVRWLTKGRI